MTPKTKNIIAWVLAGLLALAFIGSGISKLLGADSQIKNFESWGYPIWLRFPIGLIELGLAAGLLIPVYRKIAVYGVFIWTIGAVITHLQAGQAKMIGGAILFSVFAAIILYLSGEKK
jgi:uncharacterized membrane protein YphA (DoxX/SURF4 family)